MNQEQQGLDAIKAKMSPQQRQEMADIIQKELVSRQQTKSGRKTSALGPEQVSDIYSNIDSSVRMKRIEQLEKKLADAKKQQKQSRKKGNPKIDKDPLAAEMNLIPRQIVNPFARRLPARNVLLMVAILFLAVTKVLFSTGVVKASIDKAPAVQLNEVAQPEEIGVVQEVAVPHGWTLTEKELLSELDARRVQLENRRAVLEEQEALLAAKENQLASQVIELRTLVRKLSEQRKEKDHRYEARLEQLANVYGSMAPDQAAPLIGKLDETIALSLLERMPGKRMGQILSMMDDRRAIELTRRLTDQQFVD